MTLYKMKKQYFKNMNRLLSISTAIILFWGCNQAQVQNNNSAIEKDSIVSNQEDDQPAFFAKSVLDEEDIKLNDVADISGQKENTVSFIDQRIEALVGSSMKKWCEDKGVAYPPQYVMYRVFKYDEEIEVWAGKSNTDSLTLIQTFRICAMDKFPGPKNTEGDGKTPEGFYSCSNLYGSSYGFMWIKLNTGDVDEYGEVGGGSSFKLFVNYPNNVDRNRITRNFPGRKTGGDICIHGNCVSAGCISFKNRVFLAVYGFQRKHNSAKYGNIQIHIFPYRFDKHNAETFFEYSDYMALDKEVLIKFWDNLKEGFDKFNETHKPLKVTQSGEKYLFN
ncbi:MAG: hypothetical protein A2W91_03405 [Bacteroidetes bacterium GWF2_38_335]|nr:MAG: hypothetical protein A2W91_03405 [Bacteroidetes bacterium GWF2_38_335]OFY77467.1 MAG: hypothetical protein A2281_01355 [Bacteroidetes bacterium RIFOXYA12_FULL_38_20]HBS87241.1 hypothetical protein [Bacteroidales bacterium]